MVSASCSTLTSLCITSQLNTVESAIILTGSIYYNTGIKAKVENKNQYQQYLDELKPLREELGVPLKEDLYPEEK
jgi:hypothetical protein